MDNCPHALTPSERSRSPRNRRGLTSPRPSSWTIGEAAVQAAGRRAQERHDQQALANFGLVDTDGGQLSTVEKGAKSRDTIPKYISDVSGQRRRSAALSSKRRARKCDPLYAKSSLSPSHHLRSSASGCVGNEMAGRGDPPPGQGYQRRRLDLVLIGRLR
jgi:hypothetical protein